MLLVVHSKRVRKQCWDLGKAQYVPPFDLFANQETKRGEHGDAAVRDLHVRVPLRFGLLDVVEETEHVDAVNERRASHH